MPIYEPKRTFIPGTGKPAPRQPGAFTSGFATGLGQGFNYLFTGLTNDLAERRDYKKRLEGFTKAGLTLRESEALSTLSQTDPQLAGQLALGAIRQRQEPRIQLPQQQPYQGQASPQLTPVQAGPLVSGQQSIQDRMLQGLQGQMAPQAGQMAPQTMPNVAQTAQGGFPRAPIAPITTPQTPEIQQGQQGQQGQQSLRYQPTTPQERPPFSPPPGMTKKEYANFIKDQEKRQRREEDLAIKLEDLKIKKDLAKTKKETAKSTKKLNSFKAIEKMTTKIYDEGDAAKQNIIRLDQMENLVKSNQLDNPMYVQTLKSLGFDWPALLNTESNEFKALKTTFIKNAKAIFGARVTNFDLKTFMNMLPSLTQPGESNLKIIKALKTFYEIDVKKSNLLNEIVEKHDYDINPLQLRKKLDTEMKPILNKAADIFKQTISKNYNFSESFEKLPDASKFAGRRIYDDKANVTLISNGKIWRKEV